MKKVLLPVITYFITGAHHPARAQNIPSWTRIDGYSYAGTGCPAGSVSDNLASDGQTLTLMFDRYVASIGPGIAFSEKRKNCAVTIKLRFPYGWSYSLYSVDYRGYLDLQAGTTGKQTTRFWFSGDGRTGNAFTQFYGPRKGDYTIRDRLHFSQTVWSPCGAPRDLVINSSVEVDNYGAPYNYAMLTEDAQDHSVKQIYGVRWQRCK